MSGAEALLRETAWSLRDSREAKLPRFWLSSSSGFLFPLSIFVARVSFSLFEGVWEPLPGVEVLPERSDVSCWWVRQCLISVGLCWEMATGSWPRLLLWITAFGARSRLGSGDQHGWGLEDKEQVSPVPSACPDPVACAVHPSGNYWPCKLLAGYCT